MEITACSTLHNDSFEKILILKEKTKQILIAHQKKVVDGKKVPLEAIKKVRYVVFQNIKVICKKNYGFQHFCNFLTDPRSPANKFFRTGLTYLASTPCEAILNQST